MLSSQRTMKYEGDEQKTEQYGASEQAVSSHAIGRSAACGCTLAPHGTTMALLAVPASVTLPTTWGSSTWRHRTTRTNVIIFSAYHLHVNPVPAPRLMDALIKVDASISKHYTERRLTELEANTEVNDTKLISIHRNFQNRL